MLSKYKSVIEKLRLFMIFLYAHHNTLEEARTTWDCMICHYLPYLGMFYGQELAIGCYSLFNKVNDNRRSSKERGKPTKNPIFSEVI